MHGRSSGLPDYKGTCVERPLCMVCFFFPELAFSLQVSCEVEELLDLLMRTQADGNVSVTYTQLPLTDQETLRGVFGVIVELVHSSNGTHV